MGTGNSIVAMVSHHWYWSMANAEHGKQHLPLLQFLTCTYGSFQNQISCLLTCPYARGHLAFGLLFIFGALTLLQSFDRSECNRVKSVRGKNRNSRVTLPECVHINLDQSTTESHSHENDSDSRQSFFLQTYYRSTSLVLIGLHHEYGYNMVMPCLPYCCPKIPSFPTD